MEGNRTCEIPMLKERLKDSIDYLICVRKYDLMVAYWANNNVEECC